MEKIRFSRAGVAPKSAQRNFHSEERRTLRGLGLLDEQVEALQVQLVPIAQMLGARFGRKDKVKKHLERLTSAVERVDQVLSQIGQHDDPDYVDAAWRLNTAYMHISQGTGRRDGDDRLFVDYAREELGIIATVANLTIDGNSLESDLHGGFADAVVHRIYEALLQGFSTHRDSRSKLEGASLGDQPTFRFWVSRSDPFAEVVRVCLGAVGHDFDPDGAIRKYLEGSAPGQLESRYGVGGKGGAAKPKRGRPSKRRT